MKAKKFSSQPFIEDFYFKDTQCFPDRDLVLLPYVGDDAKKLAKGDKTNHG